jgi:hypothetical protein
MVNSPTFAERARRSKRDLKDRTALRPHAALDCD